MPLLRVAVCGPSDLDGRRALSVDSEGLGLAVPHLAGSFEDFADLLGLQWQQATRRYPLSPGPVLGSAEECEHSSRFELSGPS